MEPNFFAAFQDHGSLGREDFLTTSLATFFERLPNLRGAFLDWLQPHVEVPISELHWDIQCQKTYQTQKFNGARPDMVFENDQMELWFEHKLGSNQSSTSAIDGSGEEISQLAKYLRAATQYQRNTGRDVLLFFITANRKSLPREQVAPIHNADEPVGYVWNDRTRHFLWRDFYPHLKGELLALENDVGARSFDAMLLNSFVTWWTRQRKLALPEVMREFYDRDKRQGTVKILSQWISEHVSEFEESPRTWGAKAVVTAKPTHDAVRQIRTVPRPPLAKEVDWNQEDHGPHVLYCRFRLDPQAIESDLEGYWVELGDDRPCYINPWMNNGDLDIQFHVGLKGWDDYESQERRKMELRLAMEAIFARFHEITGINLFAPPETVWT